MPGGSLWSSSQTAPLDHLPPALRGLCGSSDALSLPFAVLHPVTITLEERGSQPPGWLTFVHESYLSRLACRIDAAEGQPALRVWDPQLLGTPGEPVHKTLHALLNDLYEAYLGSDAPWNTDWRADLWVSACDSSCRSGQGAETCVFLVVGGTLGEPAFTPASPGRHLEL